MSYQTDWTGRKPDGVRRVVEMKRDNLTWHIDVGDSADDEHAREIAENQSESNGGGWKFVKIVDTFPHEIGGEDEA